MRVAERDRRRAPRPPAAARRPTTILNIVVSTSMCQPARRGARPAVAIEVLARIAQRRQRGEIRPRRVGESHDRREPARVAAHARRVPLANCACGPVSVCQTMLSRRVAHAGCHFAPTAASRPGVVHGTRAVSEPVCGAHLQTQRSRSSESAAIGRKPALDVTTNHQQEPRETAARISRRGLDDHRRPPA